MPSIEKELQELTGVTQNRREGDQAYLERIVKALNDVSDNKYNKLSKDAQTWAEEATEAYNDKDEIAAFPEAAEDEDEPEEEARPRRAARGRHDEAETETESEDEPEDADDDENQPEDDDMPATRTDDDEASRKRGAKTAPARKTAPAASKSKTAAKDGKERTASPKAGGGLTYVRELLVKNPDITVPDLAEKVKAKGFAVSTQTLHTTRSGFRQDLRVLQDAGLLKRKLV